LTGSKIYIRRVDSYKSETLLKTIEDIFSTFSDSINIKRSDSVLIKPNFIAPRPVESGAITHPEVLIAIASALRDMGAKPFIAESPAWGNVKKCMEIFGYDKKFEKLGIDFMELDGPVKTIIDGSKIGISRIALEADKIINVPKFKAHQQLGATFAIKNMFGCVPGKAKAIQHLIRGKDYDRFCRMIAEIYKKLNPTLNIIDGITAMEGMGPLSGTPKHMGVMIAGADPVACERVCAEIAGFDLNRLGLFQTAKKMNLGCGDIEKIEIIGDNLESVRCPDFKQPEQIELYFSLPRVCKSIFKQILHTIKPADSQRSKSDKQQK
jgi:uncharacterized protein (DUF362 family)